MSRLSSTKEGYGEIGELIAYGLKEQVKWRGEANKGWEKFDPDLKKYREEEFLQLNKKIDHLIDNINTLAKLICKDIK